jgi:hypothetical protein
MRQMSLMCMLVHLYAVNLDALVPCIGHPLLFYQQTLNGRQCVLPRLHLALDLRIFE